MKQLPANTKKEQFKELVKQCRRTIINGKTVLIAPKGCSVSTKVFINQD